MLWVSIIGQAVTASKSLIRVCAGLSKSDLKWWIKSIFSLKRSSTHKKAKKAGDKITSAKYRKPFNFNFILLKNQRLAGKHCTPDETAHYDPSHLDLQCLQIQLVLYFALLGLAGNLA